MPKTIRYPKYLDSCALLIGGLRNLTNIEMNQIKEQYKRPGPVNENGILCELIAQHHLFSRGIEYEATPLLAPTPQGKPDIIAEGKAYDVKWLDTEFRVNQGAHQKGRGAITHYWFIKPSSGSAEMWSVPYDNVSGWEIKQLKYSPAYVKALPKEDHSSRSVDFGGLLNQYENRRNEWLKAYGEAN